MVNDEQLEERLRRFSVRGPSPSLRARVLSGQGRNVLPVRRLSDAAIGGCLAGTLATTAVLFSLLALRGEQQRIEAAKERLGSARPAESVAVTGNDAWQAQIFMLAVEQRADSDQAWKAFVDKGVLPW